MVNWVGGWYRDGAGDRFSICERDVNLQPYCGRYHTLMTVEGANDKANGKREVRGRVEEGKALE